MDLKIITERQGHENRSWTKEDYGYDTCRSITLDLSLFTPDASDYIPSGTPLGKVTSSGLYGPYSNSQKQQTITRTATGGTVDFKVGGEGDGGAAKSVVAATTAANIKAFLLGIAEVAAANPPIVVSGPTGGPWIVTGDIGDITVDATNATGGTVGSTVTNTGAGANDGTEVGAGFLFNAVHVRFGNDTGRAAAALMWQAIIDESKLPVAIDQQFRNALAGSMRFEAN